MKLLLENWREYLDESEGAPIDINKLLAMPVDQAIAIMDALVDDIDNSKLLEDYENALEEKYEMAKANRDNLIKMGGTAEEIGRSATNNFQKYCK